MKPLITPEDEKFLRACGVSTRGCTRAKHLSSSSDGTVRLMQQYGIPMTRENYLRLAFFGNPPEELDGEVEAELPEIFRYSDDD